MGSGNPIKKGKKKAHKAKGSTVASGGNVRPFKKKFFSTLGEKPLSSENDFEEEADMPSSSHLDVGYEGAALTVRLLKERHRQVALKRGWMRQKQLLRASEVFLGRYKLFRVAVEREKNKQGRSMFKPSMAQLETFEEDLVRAIDGSKEKKTAFFTQSSERSVFSATSTATKIDWSSLRDSEKNRLTVSHKKLSFGEKRRIRPADADKIFKEKGQNIEGMPQKGRKKKVLPTKKLLKQTVKPLAAREKTVVKKAGKKNRR